MPGFDRLHRRALIRLGQIIVATGKDEYDDPYLWSTRAAR